MGISTPVGRRLNLGQSLRLLQGALQLKTIVPEHTHGAAGTGTGGPITGVAPVDAEYLVGAANATLTAERVVTDTATVTWDLTTPGQAKANATVTGGITQLTGDVTAGPGSGSVAASIPNNTVSYAKMQDVSAASRLIGRGSAAGSGDPEEITPGTGLSMSGTTLNVTTGGGGGGSSIAGADFAYFIGSMGA